MAYTYVPASRISLRTAGFDERWLQQLISDAPTVLGLGELKSAGREVRQNAGGRLDFLFLDSESDTMYEVEIMLGPTDESHIIRTIEYWDIEKRRWPSHDHRAVIIAEEITNRFFNVIWLLNRSIPIIAIKLDTLVVEGKVTLSFTKVLDIYETPEGREPVQAEPVSRQQWVDWSRPESLAVVDGCLELLAQNGKRPRVTYNAQHIAVGGARRNSCWFYPRRQKVFCMVEVQVGEPNLEAVVAKLDEARVDAYRYGTASLRMKITTNELAEKRKIITETLQAGALEGGGV